MGGRASQMKGRRGELELAQYLQARGYTNAQPGTPLNYGTQPDVSGMPGLHIECKRHEKLEVSKWYAQSRADADRMKDGRPAVIYRRNREQWMILLSLEDFIDMTHRRCNT